MMKRTMMMMRTKRKKNNIFFNYLCNSLHLLTPRYTSSYDWHVPSCTDPLTVAHISLVLDKTSKIQVKPIKSEARKLIALQFPQMKKLPLKVVQSAWLSNKLL